MRLSERIRRWLHQPLWPTPRCAACDKVGPPEGPPLISGPSVYIHTSCAHEALVRVTQLSAGTSAAYPGEKPPTCCSFCGRKTIDARGVLGLFAASICRDCLELCDDLGFFRAPHDNI